MGRGVGQTERFEVREDPLIEGENRSLGKTLAKCRAVAILDPEQICGSEVSSCYIELGRDSQVPVLEKTSPWAGPIWNSAPRASGLTVQLSYVSILT